MVVGRIARWLRDEEASGPTRAARHSAIPACPLSVRFCPLHCRIQPYLIKAAPAAPLARRQRRALPW